MTCHDAVLFVTLIGGLRNKYIYFDLFKRRGLQHYITFKFLHHEEHFPCIIFMICEEQYQFNAKLYVICSKFDCVEEIVNYYFYWSKTYHL